MLLVIAGHTFTSNNLIEHLIYNIHMPLFFILTGCFIKRKKPMKSFVIEKVKRLLVPYLITCILIILANVLKLIILKDTSEIPNSVYKLVLASLYGSGLREAPILHIRLIGAICFLLAIVLLK